MPLTLVLGPANSAKAGEVLGAYAAAAPRGALLVVPTALDAEHYARELSRDGALLGSVLTFNGLAAEIARRAGFAAVRLTDLQRERLLVRTIAAAGLRRLAPSATSSGFRAAAGALIAELQRGLVTPERFAHALRSWAGPRGDRQAYGRELAALYFGYRRELERAARVDGDLYAWRALDALRAAPARWGDSAVFVYGFDDLHALQRDAIETLATLAGADVTVSLTYEPGHAALAARAEAVEELRPLATRVVEMPALDEHYDPGGREALHHLERRLFEPGARRVAAGEAVRLLEAGGERAEAELIAAEVLELVRAGVPAHEVALVVRSPDAGAPVLTRVFEQYGIEFALARQVALGHTALGRGLLALARCGLGDQRLTPVSELIGYLRTPGVIAPAVADSVEARIRRAGAATVAQARALLSVADGGRDDAVDDGDAGARAAVLEALGRLDTLRAASDPAAELAAQARRLLTGHSAGRARRLKGGQELDARACAAALGALGELHELEPEISGRELIDVLARLPVPAALPVRSGAVLISDPLSIRARRFAAVIVAGLQEGEFPRPGTPEPFLSDELRRELAAASGLRLRPREDALARERYLFYAAVSRARERLVLSYRSCDEEGNLALPSPFMRDVADLLDEGWWERRRRRLLADVVWDPDDAPTAHERRRALAAARAWPESGGGAAPSRYQLSPIALAQARHRDVVSAGALEAFAECPVKWLVERQLAPEPLEPTPEPLARGSFMHDVLERVLGGLGEAVTERSLPRALALLDQAVGELPDELAAGRPAAVREAERRAIEADLRRYLEHEAGDGCAWRPQRLEQRFGFEDRPDDLPALELGQGEDRVRVRGVIDRIDVDPEGRRAIVRDYKSGSVRQDYQGTRWATENRLQVALYMIAVRQLLGLEPVAGLYQPLRSAELRPRGVFVRDAGLGERVFAGDGCEPDELETLLDDARARALALAAQLRVGDLEPRPTTCSRDGCRYPGICRST